MSSAYVEFRRTDARQCGKPVYRLSRGVQGIAWVAWSNYTAGTPRGGGRWVITPDGEGFRAYMYARTLTDARTLAETLIPLDCEAVGDHHSDDRVTCYTGKAAPEWLCGYHASQRSA